MKSLTFLLPAAAFLCACQGGMTFKTNLDPSNFTEYFKPSQVDELSEAELLKARHKSLGTVSGLSCQIKDRDYIANVADARTDAKVKAVDLGANAIVFDKCVTLSDTPACKVSVTCYAEALLVEEQD